MKKRVIFTIIIIAITATLIWLVWSLIADRNRHDTITTSMDRVEATLREDVRFATTTITRDDYCERTQEKFGPGAKYCSQAIKARLTDITASDALTSINSTRGIISADSNFYEWRTSNERFEKRNESSTAISSSYVYGLAPYTDQSLNTCLLRAAYKTTEERNGRAYLDDTTLGDLEIRLSCSNTDWWTRNIMNRFFY